MFLFSYSICWYLSYRKTTIKKCTICGFSYSICWYLSEKLVASLQKLESFRTVSVDIYQSSRNKINTTSCVFVQYLLIFINISNFILTRKELFSYSICWYLSINSLKGLINAKNVFVQYLLIFIFVYKEFGNVNR